MDILTLKKAERASVKALYGELEKTYGYTDTDSSYLTGANTRINGQRILENMLVTKISLFVNANLSFKLLECSRNTDGTFNLVKVLYSGFAGIGLNEYDIVTTVNKDSYIGYFSTSGGISRGTKGSGFTVVGELTGDNQASGPLNNSLNFAITGTTVGLDTVSNQITSGRTITFGNALVGASTAPINQVNILGQPTPFVGRIKKINALVQSSGILAIVAFTRRENGNFDFLKMVAEMPVEIGENSLDIDVYLEKDVYLGCFSSAAVLIRGINGLGFTFAGYSTGENVVASATSMRFCLNFEMLESGLEKVKPLAESIPNQLNSNVFDIESVITDDFSNDGWSDNLSPTVANSILYYNKPTGLDQWIGKAEIVPRDIGNMPIVVMCQGTGGFYVTFDLVDNKIKIHKTWNGTPATVPDVLIEGINTVTLAQDRPFVLSVERDSIEKIKGTIIDKVTGESFSVEHVETNLENHGNGATCLGLIHKAGSYYRNRLTMATPQKVRPRLMIFGDSYVEGWNLIDNGDTFSLRYPTLIKTALSGNVSISAKGGDDTERLLAKAETDFRVIQPEYTLIAIGLNDNINGLTFNQYKANITRIINIVRNNGSVPILTTTPKLTGDSLLTQINSWVRNYSGCEYLDIHRATSLDGTDDSVIDSTLYYLDGHPNVAGHQRIFDKFKIDCDYVLYGQN